MNPDDPLAKLRAAYRSAHYPGDLGHLAAAPVSYPPPSRWQWGLVAGLAAACLATIFVLTWQRPGQPDAAPQAQQRPLPSRGKALPMVEQPTTPAAQTNAVAKRSRPTPSTGARRTGFVFSAERQTTPRGLFEANPPAASQYQARPANAKPSLLTGVTRTRPGHPQSAWLFPARRRQLPGLLATDELSSKPSKSARSSSEPSKRPSFLFPWRRSNAM